MKRLYFITIMSLLICSIASASGQEEGAASATHGKYLAGQGIIVPPDDIRINGYIAQIDYNYPVPENDDFNIFLYHGNRQLSQKGQNEIIHIGIKAAKKPFEDLPPLNLSFVIDKSGSMSSGDKMGWVKESFDIFINKVRDRDFVSLIVFSNNSQVIFPSTQMNSSEKRKEFQQAVHAIESGGGTNLVAGLEDGYAQVLANYRNDYNNRVLFLTDGVGESTGILDMAETYKEMGINLSTIGVGSNFDVNLMVDLAKKGGGSSRFISDREEMKETFGDELDRMIVPAARNLKMTLQVPSWVEIIETWGYRHNIKDQSITYDLPTLHNGDYETILAEIKINPTELTGKQSIGTFSIEYDSLEGEKITKGPFDINGEFVENSNPVYGVSDYTVLQSSTMLLIARSMIEIGETYYLTKEKINQLNNLRNLFWNNLTEEEIDIMEDQQSEYESISSDEIMRLEDEINELFQSALSKTVNTRKIVLNNRKKLDDSGFDDEILILNNYVDILGKELKMNQESIKILKENVEISTPVGTRAISDHLSNLFREVLLSLSVEETATIALIPFVQKSSEQTDFTELLNNTAIQFLGTNPSLTFVDRQNLNAIFEEQKISLSGLIDTEQALQMGKLMSAQYMLTGNVIAMNNSVAVFTRVINVTTGEVETVSQAMLPMTDELKEMIN